MEKFILLHKAEDGLGVAVRRSQIQNVTESRDGTTCVHLDSDYIEVKEDINTVVFRLN